MEDKMVFDYFYGAESEQLSFFCIPKLLISDRRFSSLSNDANLLYELILDRMSFSMRNNWYDDENRAFINYTVENVMTNLVAQKRKPASLYPSWRTLDSSSGSFLVKGSQHEFM